MQVHTSDIHNSRIVLTNVLDCVDDSFMPIIRVWGLALMAMSQRRRSECQCKECPRYHGATELLEPCWWIHYASCVLASGKEESLVKLNGSVGTMSH
jgi:hypothetical protein